MPPAVFFSHQHQAGGWLFLGGIILASVVTGIVAMRCKRTPVIVVLGLLPAIVVNIAWAAYEQGSPVASSIACLAIVSATWTLMGMTRAAGGPRVTILGRPVPFAHLAAMFTISVLGLIVVVGATRKALDIPYVNPGVQGWTMLAAVAVAVIVSFWDRSARFSWAGLYAVSASALCMMEITRDLAPTGAFPPGKFFLWAGMAEWSAFLLVAALLGWSWPRVRPVVMLLRIPGDGRWPAQWFWCAQAVFVALAAILAGWIALDISLCGMGEGLALFGLTGRGAACPSALMLLGASILMAWQSTGVWRAGWQFGSMVVGVLLTSSVSWARIDPASTNPWLSQCFTLMISAGMMTLMTGIGLPRVFRTSDWGLRGRQAAPFFGALALLMLVLVLIQKMI